MSLDPTDAARTLAARRRRTTIRCEECGTEFEATTRRRYCSNTCNVRAWRRHKAEDGDARRSAPATESGTPAAAAQPPRVAITAASARDVTWAIQPGAPPSVGAPERHSQAWVPLRVAQAEVRAALAELRAAQWSPYTDRDPLQLRFAEASARLHTALAQLNALSHQGRAQLVAAREYRAHLIGRFYVDRRQEEGSLATGAFARGQAASPGSGDTL